MFTIFTPQASGSSILSQSTVSVDSDFIYSDSDVESVAKIGEVEKIIRADVIGLALIEKAKKKPLTNTDRDRISELVIAAQINKYKKLDHEQIEILAEKICTLFSNEKKSTYYVPPIRKCQSKSNKSERARGKLVEKYRNKLHLLKSLNAENAKITKPTEEEGEKYIVQ